MNKVFFHVCFGPLINLVFLSICSACLGCSRESPKAVYESHCLVHVANLGDWILMMVFAGFGNPRYLKPCARAFLARILSITCVIILVISQRMYRLSAGQLRCRRRQCQSKVFSRCFWVSALIRSQLKPWAYIEIGPVMLCFF